MWLELERCGKAWIAYLEEICQKESWLGNPCWASYHCTLVHWNVPKESRSSIESKLGGELRIQRLWIWAPPPAVAEGSNRTARQGQAQKARYLACSHYTPFDDSLLMEETAQKKFGCSHDDDDPTWDPILVAWAAQTSNPHCLSLLVNTQILET